MLWVVNVSSGQVQVSSRQVRGRTGRGAHDSFINLGTLTVFFGFLAAAACRVPRVPRVRTVLRCAVLCCTVPVPACSSLCRCRPAGSWGPTRPPLFRNPQSAGQAIPARVSEAGQGTPWLAFVSLVTRRSGRAQGADKPEEVATVPSALSRSGFWVGPGRS